MGKDFAVVQSGAPSERGTAPQCVGGCWSLSAAREATNEGEALKCRTERRQSGDRQYAPLQAHAQHGLPRGQAAR